MLFKRLSFWLLGADILLLAAGSVFERLGSSQIYSSPLAVTLWGVTALVALIDIFKVRLFKRPALFLLHLSLVMMLAGALTTHIYGTDQTVNLRLNTPVTLDNGKLKMELLDFCLDYYPGTSITRDYRSTLQISVQDHPVATGTTALNNVLEIHGYRFFQMAYDSDAQGSVIEVSHDPTGNAITLSSYMLLFLSLILIFLPGSRKKHFRTAAASLLFLSATPTAFSLPSALPDSVARKFGDIMVMHNDRVAPLSTLARDFTVKLTGHTSVGDYSAEQTLTGYLFYPYSWMDQSVIAMRDDESTALAAMAANGALWRIFPVKMPDGNIQWFSPADNVPSNVDLPQWQFIRLTPNYLAELVARGDWAEVSHVIDKIIKYQEQTAPEAIPSAGRMAAERFYCHCSRFILPSVLFMLLGFALFFFPGRTLLSAATDFIGLLWSASLIVTNWIATDQIPMAGGHETMCWLSFLAFLLPWLWHSKTARLMPMAIIAGALALLVAKMGSSSPQLTPLQPVLHSPLLSVHVLTIMLSYAMMLLMLMCGVATLSGKEGYATIGRQLLKPAVALLTAGIFIGAIWANNSWGRYWGWDPKEVWALITMLIYCYPLHFAMSRKAYATFCILAFLSVVMTYFGVNYLLGGLHSYGA